MSKSVEDLAEAAVSEFLNFNGFKEEKVGAKPPVKKEKTQI